MTFYPHPLLLHQPLKFNLLFMVEETGTQQGDKLKAIPRGILGQDVKQDQQQSQHYCSLQKWP